MLKIDFLEQHEDGVIFYRVYSDVGKAVLQVETGDLYDEVAITSDDTHTYIESDTYIDESYNEDVTTEDLAEVLERLGL